MLMSKETSVWEAYSLGPLRSLRNLLHYVDEPVGPVPGRADVDTEEILLGGRGQGERVPLQLRDGRAIEKHVLPHLHFETALHQLQLQHPGRPHHDLREKQTDYAAAASQATLSAAGGTYLSVSDRLHVTNET